MSLARSCAVLVLLWGSSLAAQTCVMLSPAEIKPDGTASMELSLYSTGGDRPVALQWSILAPSSQVSRINVEDGPAIIASGKTSICTGEAGVYQCLVAGANANTIANGVIARLIAVLVPGSSVSGIQISKPMGVSAAGYFIPAETRIRTVVRGDLSRDCRLRPTPRTAAIGR